LGDIRYFLFKGNTVKQPAGAYKNALAVLSESLQKGQTLPGEPTSGVDAIT
jgi:hypothetical protein